MLTLSQQRIVTRLHSIGAIRFGNFRLKDGRISRIYVDLRLVQSVPDLNRAIALEFARMIADEPLQVLAPVPVAAVAFISTLSIITGLPMVTPRIDEKGHGSGAKVDGIITPGKVVGVFDDLITSSKSKIQAALLLIQQSLIVEGIYVLLTREQGGEEELARLGYKLRSAFTLREALAFLRSDGKLDGNTHAEILTDLARGRQELGLPMLD